MWHRASDGRSVAGSCGHVRLVWCEFSPKHISFSFSSTACFCPEIVRIFLKVTGASSLPHPDQISYPRRPRDSNIRTPATRRFARKAWSVVYLWNVDELSDYTTQQPRRQPTSVVVLINIYLLQKVPSKTGIFTHLSLCGHIHRLVSTRRPPVLNDVSLLKLYGSFLKMLHTRCCNQVNILLRNFLLIILDDTSPPERSTPASYLGDLGFRSVLADRLSRYRYSSVPPGKCRNFYLN
jgi:hypothetical protein